MNCCFTTTFISQKWRECFEEGASGLVLSSSDLSVQYCFMAFLLMLVAILRHFFHNWSFSSVCSFLRRFTYFLFFSDSFLAFSGDIRGVLFSDSLIVSWSAYTCPKLRWARCAIDYTVPVYSHKYQGASGSKTWVFGTSERYDFCWMMLNVRFQECIDHLVITKAEFNNTWLIKHLRSLREKIKQVMLKHTGRSALEEIVDRNTFVNDSPFVTYIFA